MPIDRDHAFADGPAFRRPRRLARFRGAAARAAEAWKRFDASATVAEGCALGPNAWCVNSAVDQARITLAAGVICRGLLRIEKFGAGEIHIGARAYIGDDCLLSSSSGIEIEEQVLIAHGVQIFDNDSHPLESSARSGDYEAVLVNGERSCIAASSICIKRRAWIGFNALILKGVTIGENSVVAAGKRGDPRYPRKFRSGGKPGTRDSHPID